MTALLAAAARIFLRAARDDFLVGDKGADVFFDNGGKDIIKGFNDNVDILRIADHTGGFGALDISKVGKNLLVEYDGGEIVLRGQGNKILTDADFDFV